jgi:hypothetical protein
MADKMRLRHLRWEYDAVRGAINALDREYEAGGDVDTLDYRAQREILVSRMWECFNRIKDEYDNQRKERVKNAT